MGNLRARDGPLESVTPGSLQNHLAMGGDAGSGLPSRVTVWPLQMLRLPVKPAEGSGLTVTPDVTRLEMHPSRVRTWRDTGWVPAGSPDVRVGD
jgi:hypothetical protein